MYAKLLLRMITFVTVMVGACLAAGPAVASNVWKSSLEEAQQEAAQTGRLILVHFWSEHCGPCMQLEGRVFSQRACIHALRTNYVPVKINVQQHPELVSAFRVERIPTDVILTASGEELFRTISPADLNRYVRMLDQVAAHHRIGQQVPTYAAHDVSSQRQHSVAVRGSPGSDVVAAGPRPPISNDSRPAGPPRQPPVAPLARVPADATVASHRPNERPLPTTQPSASPADHPPATVPPAHGTARWINNPYHSIQTPANSTPSTSPNGPGAIERAEPSQRTPPVQPPIGPAPQPSQAFPHAVGKQKQAGNEWFSQQTPPNAGQSRQSSADTKESLVGSENRPPLVAATSEAALPSDQPLPSPPRADTHAAASASPTPPSPLSRYSDAAQKTDIAVPDTRPSNAPAGATAPPSPWTARLQPSRYSAVDMASTAGTTGTGGSSSVTAGQRSNDRSLTEHAAGPNGGPSHATGVERSTGTGTDRQPVEAAAWPTAPDGTAMRGNVAPASAPVLSPGVAPPASPALTTSGFIPPTDQPYPASQVPAAPQPSALPVKNPPVAVAPQPDPPASRRQATSPSVANGLPVRYSLSAPPHVVRPPTISDWTSAATGSPDQRFRGSPSSAGNLVFPSDQGQPPSTAGPGPVPLGTRGAATAPPGLDGFCPVALVEENVWRSGNPQWMASHEGRIYFMSSPDKLQAFQQNPQRYAPVLSGFDVVRFRDSGVLVPGKREHGLAYGGRYYLFADEESLQRFWQHPQIYSATATEPRTVKR